MANCASQQQKGSEIASGVVVPGVTPEPSHQSGGNDNVPLTFPRSSGGISDCVLGAESEHASHIAESLAGVGGALSLKVMLENPDTARAILNSLLDKLRTAKFSKRGLLKARVEVLRRLVRYQSMSSEVRLVRVPSPSGRNEEVQVFWRSDWEGAKPVWVFDGDVPNKTIYSELQRLYLNGALRE